MKRYVGMALVLCLPVQLTTAAEQAYLAPRTEYGAPDLQGVWSLATQTNLERPDQFAGKLAVTREEARQIESLYQAFADADSRPSDPDREAPAAGLDVGGYNAFWMDPGERLAIVNGEMRTSILVEPADGKLPYSDQGRANRAAAIRLRNTYAGPEVRPMGERCVVGFGSTGGPPKLPVLYNNMTRIVQNEHYVVLLAEMNHDVRIIRLNSEFLSPPQYQWMGDSVGYYEGDTLVVTTTHFHPQQGLRAALEHHFYGSRDMQVTERFTRIDDATILYQFTVDDPQNYSEPWSGELPMNRSSERIFEYACHEGNYALPGILAGARRAEVAATAEAGSTP